MLDKKIEMTDLMAESDNTKIDIYSRDITIHYHCKIHLCNQPLDHKRHDNFQKIPSLSYHERVVPTINSLARCQTDLQKNYASKTRDNFQARHPQLHLKFLILKLQ